MNLASHWKWRCLVASWTREWFSKQPKLEKLGHKSVNARKFSRPILKSCNFVSKIRLYQFLIYKTILQFYKFHVSIDFTLLPIRLEPILS